LLCGNPAFEQAGGHSCASLNFIVSMNGTVPEPVAHGRFRVMALLKTKAYRVNALKKLDT